MVSEKFTLNYYSLNFLDKTDMFIKQTAVAAEINKVKMRLYIISNKFYKSLMAKLSFKTKKFCTKRFLSIIHFFGYTHVLRIVDFVLNNQK